MGLVFESGVTARNDHSPAVWAEQTRRSRRRYSAGDLVDLKRRNGTRIAVCLPALNEASTIGRICSVVSSQLMSRQPVVDELLVVDTGSQDATADAARAAGATVYAAREILRDHALPPGVDGGKGDALWKSLAVSQADVIVWLDSDTRNFGEHFVTDLVGPLLEDDEIVFSKAFYRRPLMAPSGTANDGGARVTELVARPLLNMLYPQLAGVVQPLSGEYAGWRDLLASLPFFTGYAVDIGLLLDIVQRHGASALVQADLGLRVHHNQDVLALGRMSMQVLQALFLRLQGEGRARLEGEIGELVQFVFDDDGPKACKHHLQVAERRPMSEVLSGAP